MKYRIFALLCALMLAFLPAAGAETASILAFKAARSGAEDAADWLEHGLPELMGAGGEWYVIGLVQSGERNLAAAHTALINYLESHTVRAASTRQKLALTLLALGGDHAFVEKTLADSIGKQGLMSWVWGLHLLNNGCKSPAYMADDCIKTLLDLRKADGGWAITGNQADADATAMVLQALAPHREQAEVAVVIEAALTLLSSMQAERGGFSSYGVENAESAAQVIIALCALQIDPLTDARFIKNGFTAFDAMNACRLADGSYSHEADGVYSESATAQAFLAYAAHERFKAGQGSLYLLDANAASVEVKPAMGYRPVAAAVIGGIALTACIVFLLLGKRHPKNFLAIAMLAAGLIGAVYATDFQSAENYYAGNRTKTDAIGDVTLTIRCDKVTGKAAHIPQTGLILPETSLPIAGGDTVYTVLTDAARAHGIHLEASGAQGLMYVHGIGNIYEFDFGDLSGWLYSVNGETFSVGCAQYVLKPGDHVEWRYTLELGKDIE